MYQLILQPFWFSSPLLSFVDICLDGQIGIRIKELFYLMATLAPACGTPGGNRCSTVTHHIAINACINWMW